MIQGYLAYLDQLRYIAGFLIALFTLCHGILPPKPRCGLRITVSCLFAVAAALARIPYWALVSRFDSPFLLAPYWVLMSFLPCGIVLFCYQSNVPGALFRTMLTAFVDNFSTILSYHLFVLCLFPGYPQEHPAFYTLLVVILYCFVLLLNWAILRPILLKDESACYLKPSKTGLAYLITYLFYIFMISAGKFFCESFLSPISGDAAYHSLYSGLVWFIVLFLLLVSVAMTTIMVAGYSALTLRSEQQALQQILRERESQYEFSRENIEMINRKAHDLKHQIRALEQVSDEERRQQLRQTRKAIDFYDAVVKTGNEALDTLLTEKSVYCSNRSIRLSCTVSTKQLEKIGVVDLYTLLGNAIDNAIESVDRLEEEKRVISLTIRDQGKMLYLQVDNYYEGVIEMEEGLPLTTKEDKDNHGYGVKSMRMIVERYRGTMRINTDGQIFSLQILIP